MVGQNGHQLGQVGGKDGVLPVDELRLNEGLDVLIELPQPVFGPFRHPAGLGEAHHRPGGQVMGGGGQVPVAGGQQPVGGALPLAVPVPGGQRLAHRQEYRVLQPGHPALTVHVEQAHGVHVGVPELNAHRVILGRGVYVQNAAPEGKLAHALHLLAPGVPQRRQPVGKLRQVVLPALLHRHDVPGQLLRGQGALHEALHRGHDQGRFIPGHVVEGGQTLVLPLAGGHRAVVEQKFPGGQQGDALAGEGGQVFGQPVGLRLVGAHHHHRAVHPPVEPGGEMGPV